MLRVLYYSSQHQQHYILCRCTSRRKSFRSPLNGEFHPGLKFQPGFWNKSSENQVVDYMERDSARAENPSPVFSDRPNGLKNPCNRYHFFSPGWNSPCNQALRFLSSKSRGGGGTLGISGWGCAARTLEPLAYTRANFSWILLPYTRVNSLNHSWIPIFDS